MSTDTPLDELKELFSNLSPRDALHRSEFINSPSPSKYEAEATRFGGCQVYLSSLSGEIDRIARYSREGDIALEEIPRRVVDVGRAAFS